VERGLARVIGGLPELPRILVAVDGRRTLDRPVPPRSGLLLRDTELGVVCASATSGAFPLALDIDTVRGLGTDDAAVAFVVERLGIEIVLTRRPGTALRAAELGALGLLHVLAFDSTGLGRSLDGHPRADGVGTVVSPGLVLSHMSRSELEQLPRPILGYGLMTEPADVMACLRLADAVALRPAAAAALADLDLVDQGDPGTPLTTVLAQE
jgi:glycerol-3-phosphate responsive antiterminator